MNRLDRKRQIQILNILVEGGSMRSASRLVDVSINTVTKLLIQAGRACTSYQDTHLRNLTCKNIQCDEIWSFCYSKSANVPDDKQGQFGYGDLWTWTSLCADCKLVPSWLVLDRSAAAAKEFMMDLSGRLKNRVQLTTDGHKAYLQAVEGAFGSDIDYAMLRKLYGGSPSEGEKRYSPAPFVGTEVKSVMGEPNPRRISTSFVERQNLTMRMSMRRFTRLTNGFSKKAENHTHALALYFMYYNFIRVHKSLRVTPAMEAGVSRHVWGLEEVIDLIDRQQQLL